MTTEAPIHAEARDSGNDDPQELADWIESFDAVVQHHGIERAQEILRALVKRAALENVKLPGLIQTPYVNTIAPQDEPEYPGDEEIETRIKQYVRWNAVAIVLRANHRFPGLGGHLSTYASAASLYEVGFNHFFHGKDKEPGDQIFFQGHASPGIYARAYLLGRLTNEQFDHFRREAAGPGTGLSSYPHPWLMPEFWEFPTVSMGLGPIAAIYQARFNRYLHNRGIRDTSRQRVWAFLGDGECDEPEALGALHVAAREGLDNLVFVVNCNLQRLDGPVRGNGKIIQELEANFHGAGWDVFKVIWGREWDPLLAADKDGLLVGRMNEVVDGEFQKYSVESGAYVREHFFGKDPRLLKMVEHLSDDDIRRLRRGGHDMKKLHAAFDAACRTNGRPAVVLAKTVKGFALGEGAEGRNVAHQQKKLSVTELKAFRDRLGLDVPDAKLEEGEAPLLVLEKGSREYEYIYEHRMKLGGFLPKRIVRKKPLEAPPLSWFSRFLEGGGADQDASTTGAFARLLAQLLSHPELGKRVVPIIPDEARTFGLDALFRKFGIYSSVGQLYEPVDKAMVLYYREAKDGQVLEEGITEAGAMASFTAAGTCYATHGEPMIPFYIYYSMFGFQRTGDQIWAFGDSRGRGFLLGATAGRTTLNGEGLQHEDGHSHVLASTVPSCLPYDPAFAYEIAVIIQDGLRRMFQDGEDVFYYLTLQNEPYVMPKMPDGVEKGILEGVYLFKPASALAAGASAPASLPADAPRVRLLGSGSILVEVLRAQQLLAERFGVAADVFSATSYPLLRREALAAERWNRLHPTDPPRIPRVTQILAAPLAGGVIPPIVAASDYMKQLPHMVSPWIPGGLFALGTDGFGRSDTRETLRRHFEVDAESVAAAAL
ncbi:MAG TPA: pyruvate dehydrogenase (acetyl-transferring), homodimeric type, partial [Planctomycetota bacterium]|nr:pyruvate dehydrogenase (acetyl-transferring), homodimeric type [Planctomycetota bacterium]